MEEPVADRGGSRLNETLRCAVGWGSVCLIATCFWFPHVVWDPLRHWDEAWYAEVSRQFLFTPDLLTPTWNGHPWFHKPPLSYWATLAFYRSFGVSEWTARSFSLICAYGTLLLVMAWMTRRRGLLLGSASGMLLIALPEFCRYATRGQLDVPVTFFLTVQSLSFLAGLERSRWHLLGGLAFGVGLMTKGMAAGLAYVIQGTYAVVAWDFRFLRQPAWWGGMVLGLAIAAPWHVQMARQHGEAFIKEYFSRHLVQFFVDIYPETDAPAAPVWYYLKFLIDKQPEWGVPALLGWLGATAVLLHRRADRRYVFLWCWVTAVPLVLSFSWAKWSWYLVPIYPPLAMLFVDALPSSGSRGGRDRWVLGGTATLAIACGICLALFPAWKEHEAEIRALGPALEQSLPVAAKVWTLQGDRARTSIYPISVCFYSHRGVVPVVGVEALARGMAEGPNPKVAAVHEQFVPAIEEAGRSYQFKYSVEVIAREGDVVAIRVTPSADARP